MENYPAFSTKERLFTTTALKYEERE